MKRFKLKLILGLLMVILVSCQTEEDVTLLPTNETKEVQLEQQRMTPEEVYEKISQVTDELTLKDVKQLMQNSHQKKRLFRSRSVCT